jgi:chorismate dehydratase
VNLPTSSSSERLRVSAIRFLNTLPLMYDFTHPPTDAQLREHFDVHFTLPSQCADELRTGAADIGIIPVAALAEIPRLHIIRDVAIAAKAAVRSILLISKRPLEQVKTVAADTSSRTSVALLRVLFARRWKAAPDFVPEPPQIKRMLAVHDAALVIGDPALYYDLSASPYQCFDLAAEWIAMTGTPFVFALWALREEKLDLARNIDPAAVFLRSRDNGVAHVHQLASEASGPDASRAHIEHYLRHNIDYSLDAANLDGLKLFFRYAHECGALPDAPELRWL